MPYLSIVALVGAAATAPAGKPPMLTTVDAVNAVIDDGMRKKCYFAVTGTVVSSRARSFVLDGGNSRIALFSNVFAIPKTGDVVRVDGWTRDNGNRWDAIAYSGCSVIGRAPIPPRKEVSFAEVASGACNLQDVRIAHCTVEGAYHDEVDNRWNLLVLREGGSSIFAHIPEKGDTRLDSLKKLVGARIRPSGICYNCTGGIRRHIGVSVVLQRIEDIEILEPPPEDPFDLPRLDNFYAATPQSIAALGRRKVDGTVIACWHGDCFLLKTDSGECMRINLAEGEHCPQARERVEVIGKPETDLYRINFSQARARAVAGARIEDEPVVETSAEKILSDNHGRMSNNPSWYGKIVRLHGFVRTKPAPGAPSSVFHIDSAGITVTVDVSSLGEGFTPPKIGSEVLVTGACLFECGVWREASPLTHAEGLSVVVRSPEDVTTLRAPFPLTTWHLCGALGMTVALLACFAWWNRRLAVCAERRGRELANERLSHTKAKVKVEERTRLAVELHDSMSQTLTGVAMHIDSAIASMQSADTRAGHSLSTAQSMLHSCRKELQDCLWDLRSRTFEESDMTEAVYRTIRPHLGATSAVVRFNVPRDILSEQTTHTVLRIVRELVVNAIRHGHATHIRIAGTLKDGVIMFSVKDNGSGFCATTANGPSNGHFGLQGIRERLLNYNGSMSVENSPDGGADFRIVMNDNITEDT